MNRPKLIKILMNTIYPKFRNDWWTVERTFKKDFNVEITKEEWEKYLNENTLL